MRKAAEAVGALAIGVAGTIGVVALSLGMNGVVERDVAQPATVLEPTIAAPRTDAPTARRQRISPVIKPRRSAPSPGPLLHAGLSGLDFGLGDPADAGLAGATAALVEDLGGAVMDAGAVAQAPIPVRRAPPDFPARARALGRSGHVALSFVVDVDGSVQDVVVVEADPPGVFDEAAVAAVRAWEFQPGQHEGAPVAVRVRQTLVFELE